MKSYLHRALTELYAHVTFTNSGLPLRIGSRKTFLCAIADSIGTEPWLMEKPVATTMTIVETNNEITI